MHIVRISGALAISKCLLKHRKSKFSEIKMIISTVLLKAFKIHHTISAYLHVKCEKVLRSVSVKFAITSGDFGPITQSVVNKDVTSCRKKGKKGYSYILQKYIEMTNTFYW